MNDFQFLILFVITGGGFSWMVTWLISINHRLNDLENRITVIQTILAMMGAPLKGLTIERKDP